MSFFTTSGCYRRSRRCTCKMCGVSFSAFRRDALTCGPRCRKARQRQAAELAAADALSARINAAKAKGRAALARLERKGGGSDKAKK